MGTPEFAVPSLEILLRNTYEVAAVVTAPDKPRGRGQELSPTPVKRAALLHGLPVLQPERLEDPAFVSDLAGFKPDLAVIVAFRILPKDVFTLPRLGTFNLHASLLPRYRGAAPINWAIINGEAETGVTTFFLEEAVDTGKMIMQRSVPILPDDDAGSLHVKLAAVGANTVLETVRCIERGTVSLRVQDSSLASRAPKIFKDDCRIHWNLPSVRVHNHVRGLSPVPGAFTALGDRMIKIYRTRLLDAPSAGAPGAVTITGAELHVATADRGIAVVEMQQEGKRRMTAEEFLRGSRLRTGEQFS